MKTIIYVGFREKMTDPLYGTGEWSQDNGGTVKSIHDDVAKKMLVHTDVWSEHQVKHDSNRKFPLPVVETVTPPAEDTEAEEAQRVRDSITAMENKQAIADFISANYSGIKLDKRASIDSMKQEAIGIVDRFGVTP